MQARRPPFRDKNRRQDGAGGRPGEPKRFSRDGERDKSAAKAKPARNEAKAEPSAKGAPGGRGQVDQGAAPRTLPPKPAGKLPVENLPLILETRGSGDYALLDSGEGRKLERYGPLLIDRPENQAIWRRNLSLAEWSRADAVFTGDTDEEGMGRWRFPREALGETWPLAFDGLSYLGRFTSFRHVGVFPEQASHWRHFSALIEKRRAERPGSSVRVLNLFGYTGVASLAAARAGAHVTHVDASKKAVGWARENAQVAGLEGAPIRWIVDDARVFAERELRRESRYDIILLDPPAYGRGPKGEVWELFADLPGMVALSRELLTENPLALVLTAYSIRMSFFATHALLRDALAGKGGVVESGELVIREEAGSRALSTSLFSRWVAEP
ncbi:MAG TPA: RsmD family RNA methyltransferase [Mesorhizobium sp.]|jgi:23S rRNA (cytosine1962-C5)-methyltransferase|nr:RsmD family RNA methyltransferase [Mesorhizobium sp.]